MIDESDSLITIPYEEVQGSPIETMTDRGLEATRILECPFDDRLTLAAQLRGGMRLIGQAYVYIRPQPYPHNPSAVVEQVKVEPFGATRASEQSTLLAYNLARLTVSYRVPQFGGDTPEQRLVSETLEPVVEFLTLPHERFYWDDAGTQPLSESEAPSKLLRMLDWVYTRHQMPVVPAATLELVGKVNQATLTSASLGLTFPAQTLLYNPPHLDRQITTEGAKAWRVTYRFTYRPETWNKFPRRGQDAMQTIYRREGQSPVPFAPYEPADFTAIVG